MNYLTKLANGFREVSRYFQYRYKPNQQLMNTKEANLGLETKAGLPTVSPERIAREAAQLNAMVAGMNKEAGVQPDPEAQVVTSVKYPPAPTPATLLEKEKREVTHSRSPFDPKLIFYTGALRSGKDFVAAATGATIFGLAQPLYRMREVFFGAVDKDRHGARSFLQTAGNWGRGTVSAQYPLTAGRANFVMMVRDIGSAGKFGFSDVRWEKFGLDPDLWLNAMLKRIEKYRSEHGNEDKRVAVVNARFKNEIDALTSAGFTGWHVMASPETWAARLKAAGLDPKSPELTDASEAIALDLNKQAFQSSLRAPARKLRCVWSDDKQAPPSKAFFTLDEFLKELELFS